MSMQHIDQRSEFCLRADFRIEPIVVNDVVAVRRTRARLHYRRGIDMADAKSRQIGYEPDGVTERELPVELQAIGSADGREAIGPLGHQAAERARASSITAATRCSVPSSTMSSSVRDKCRRQLGCASIVPGKFACSASEITSSS